MSDAPYPATYLEGYGVFDAEPAEKTLTVTLTAAQQRELRAVPLDDATVLGVIANAFREQFPILAMEPGTKTANGYVVENLFLDDDLGWMAILKNRDDTGTTVDIVVLSESTAVVLNTGAVGVVDEAGDERPWPSL